MVSNATDGGKPCGDLLEKKAGSTALEAC